MTDGQDRYTRHFDSMAVNLDKSCLRGCDIDLKKIKTLKWYGFFDQAMRF